MSKTLLRGLELIEEIGLHGPLTITEIARRTGVHITIVSRTVRALEAEAWLSRVDGKVVTGPRCALLGAASPASQVLRRAEPLVRAIAGVTGAAVSANGLIGRDVMVLAWVGHTGAERPDTVLGHVPLNVMAGGRAIAAQLSIEQLDAALPPEPFPSAEQVLASLDDTPRAAAYFAGFPADGAAPAGPPVTRAALDSELEAIRAAGFAYDHGELDPGIHCIAAPWPVPGLPASLACFAARDVITEGRETIERCLRAAVAPGAGVQNVVDAAAH
jgi:DNA-binding IclR family transcriptional regulator